DRPTYVLDELPPLVYAPSVAILARLADRRPAAPAGPRSLLTVAPTYPKGGVLGVRFPRTAGLKAHELWGKLPPLEHTQQESEEIQRCFGAARVLALQGSRASKAGLVKALPGRQVVHIAAHGIADDRFDNNFGALVLTPPAQVTAEDD